MKKIVLILSGLLTLFSCEQSNTYELSTQGKLARDFISTRSKRGDKMFMVINNSVKTDENYSSAIIYCPSDSLLQSHSKACYVSNLCTSTLGLFLGNCDSVAVRESILVDNEVSFSCSSCLGGIYYFKQTEPGYIKLKIHGKASIVNNKLIFK